MWMVLEDGSSNDLLLAVYAGNDFLVRNGTVSERVAAIDVALEGPTCEYPAAGLSEDLIQVHELAVSTAAETVRLGPLERARIAIDGTALNVATGLLQKGFALGEVTAHGPYGPAVAFSVWPEPL